MQTQRTRGPVRFCILHSAFCIVRRALVSVLASTLIVGERSRPDSGGRRILRSGHLRRCPRSRSHGHGDARRHAPDDVDRRAGHLPITDIADGPWSIRIEMRGFANLTREVTIGPDAQPAMWELSLLPFEEIARGLPPPPPASARHALLNPDSNQTRHALAVERAEPPTPQTGFQRAGVTAPQAPPSRQAAAPPPDDPPADAAAAADGFLINGSVNNGAASPFAQPAAFGNNRRRAGALYNGMVGGLFSNSVWDARPYSLTGVPMPQAGLLQRASARARSAGRSRFRACRIDSTSSWDSSAWPTTPR